jgi:uncharacterized protein YaeQ
MALNSMMYVFTVRLADADRGVYEALTLRVAQHPSEAAEYLVTRVLAYCLEYAEALYLSLGEETLTGTVELRRLITAAQ